MDGMVLPDDTPDSGSGRVRRGQRARSCSRWTDRCSDRTQPLPHLDRRRALRFVGRLEIDGTPPPRSNSTSRSTEPGASVDVRAAGRADRADASAGELADGLAELSDAQPWAPAGHVVAREPVRPARRSATAATAIRGSSASRSARVDRRRTVALGPAELRRAAPAGCRRLFGLEVAGPRFELWRGPTDNDRSAMRGSFELGAPEDTGGEGAPGPSSEQRWRERGLDRLTSRIRSVDAGRAALTVRSRCGAASSGLFVDVDYYWRLTAEGLELTTEISPIDRLGLHVATRRHPVRPARRRRPGPLVRHRPAGVLSGFLVRGALVGQFAAGIDELNVRYSRPQETGHRPDLRWLVLSDADRPRLRLASRPGPGGHRPGFTFTRHTPQDAGPRPASVRTGRADGVLPVPRRRRPWPGLPRLRHRRTAPTRPLAELRARSR